MKVTENGKAVFLAAMERAKKDVCRIELVRDDQGNEGLNIGLVSSEEAIRLVEIDGVKFDLSVETEEFLRPYVFDGQGDKLRVGIPDCGCGCGHCHEGDCCCGEDCGGGK